MSDQKCTVCGESSILREEGSTVCMNCGTVLSEVQTFFIAEENIGYQDTTVFHANLPARTRSLRSRPDLPLVKQCKSKMRGLCARLAYNYEMAQAANKLFEQAYKHGEFKRMHAFSKNMLSHCCVYITGRQFNFPITIKEFCSITRQPVSDIARLYQKLISKLNIDVQYQSLASLITYHLSDKIFNRECLDMVKDILKLYERKRTRCSPHRDVTIGLAAFLAWGSMNFAEYRKSNITVFAKKHKFIFTPIWRVRLRELLEILTQVGSRLPWITNTTGKHFVVNNLKSILEFQNSLLLKDVLEDESEEGEDDENECDSTDEEEELENVTQESENKDLEGGNDEKQRDQGCMYMCEDPESDNTCATSEKCENENTDSQNKQTPSDAVCVEIESARSQRPQDYTELAGKTFVYHSTLRVISADLPSS